jgi:uncharacterized membrane protein
MFFPPFILLFIILFFFLLAFLFGLVHWGLISYAFAKIGIPPGQMFSLLFLCLIGSFINIPIKKIPTTHLVMEEVVTYWGMRFRIPRYWPGYTVIAVNLGGAIIPVCISLYLLTRFGHFFITLLAIAIVSFVTNRFARPVPGIGITVPLFIPPLVAALTAIVLAPHHAPALAYIAGTMGTLIGADLMNLDKIKKLGAPVASIGGAGTFDGIFFTGILAVLLA